MQTIFKKNDLKHPKLLKNNEFTESRSSVKIKQDELKENITYIYCNQTNESQ